MNRRAALSLGEMAMFTAYLLVGVLIFTAALNIHDSTYKQSINASLMAACNSMVDIADTAYSTGQKEVDISEELDMFEERGIDISAWAGREITAKTVRSKKEYSITCYAHAAEEVYILGDINKLRFAK